MVGQELNTVLKVNNKLHKQHNKPHLMQDNTVLKELGLGNKRLGFLIYMVV
jgi:hypothetical protein